MAKKVSATKAKARAKRPIKDAANGRTGATRDVKTPMNEEGISLSRATAAAKDSMRKSADAVVAGDSHLTCCNKNVLGSATEAARSVGRAVGRVAADVGGATARGAGVVSSSLLDLNNDGRIDEEDLRIATERGILLAKQVAEELASSDTVKSTGKAAIVVATIAIPVPLIGPGFGALVGGGGYLAVKAVKEIVGAIGTAVRGVPGAVVPKRMPRKRKVSR